MSTLKIERLERKLKKLEDYNLLNRLECESRIATLCDNSDYKFQTLMASMRGVLETAGSIKEARMWFDEFIKRSNEIDIDCTVEECKIKSLDAMEQGVYDFEFNPPILTENIVNGR